MHARPPNCVDYWTCNICRCSFKPLILMCFLCLFLFPGYMGVACEQCMLGWSPTSDMKSCLKLASVQEVLAMGLESNNPTVGEDEMVTASPSGGVNFLTVVIVVSLLSVVSYCMFHWWRNRTQPPEHRHHRLSTDAGDQHRPNNNAPSSRGSNPPLTLLHINVILLL